MNESQTKNIFTAIFVFGVGFLVFKLATPTLRKSVKKNKTSVNEAPAADRKKIAAPPAIDETQAANNPKAAQAHLSLSVYIDALNNGAGIDELDALNKELMADLGMKVYRRRSDDKLVVSDLNGADIMEYDAPSATIQE